MGKALLEEAVEVKIHETSEESEATRLAVMLDVRGVQSTVLSAPKGLFDLTPGHFSVLVSPDDLDASEAILQEFLRRKAIVE